MNNFRTKKLKETLVALHQLENSMINLKTWLGAVEYNLSSPLQYENSDFSEIQKKINEQQVAKYTEENNLMSYCYIVQCMLSVTSYNVCSVLHRTMYAQCYIVQCMLSVTLYNVCSVLHCTAYAQCCIVQCMLSVTLHNVTILCSM